MPLSAQTTAGKGPFEATLRNVASTPCAGTIWICHIGRGYVGLFVKKARSSLYRSIFTLSPTFCIIDSPFFIIPYTNLQPEQELRIPNIYTHHANMTTYNGKCHCGQTEWTVKMDDSSANHILW